MVWNTVLRNVVVWFSLASAIGLHAQVDQNKINPTSNKRGLVENTKQTFQYDPSIPFATIIPKGFTIREKQSLQGLDYYILQDSAKRLALINQQGDYIFHPAKSQNFKAIEGKIWLTVKNGIYRLYDEQLNLLTQKNYVKIEQLDARYLIANIPGSSNIDIFTVDGKLFSAAQFSALIRSGDLGYSVYDSQNRVACTADSLLKKQTCLPFAEILALRNHDSLFIARSTEMYGLVNDQGIEIIPMSYKKIVHLKELDLLEGMHDFFNFDLYDIQGKLIYRSFPGFYNFRKITDDFYHAKAEDDHLIYNTQTKQIVKITHLGYLKMDKDLLENKNLLTFIHDEQTEYYSAKTGEKWEASK
ncbi:MAG TPA: hypothetical protein PKD51_07500 [Saprospiraceae bacterium]|nr:hypothetical protein [Saprospiraceae bacterium]HMU04750.1 hypothetical protein [Saprospiraceae bacterium]